MNNNNIILHILSDSNISNIEINKDNNIFGLNKNNNILSSSISQNINKILGKFTYNHKKKFVLFNNKQPKSFVKYQNLDSKLLNDTIFLIGKNKFKVQQSKHPLIIENLITGKKHTIKNKASIGRNPGNTIILKDNLVSDVHATITYKKSDYHIIDNNSINGIYVIPNKNGHPIKYDNKIIIDKLEAIVSRYPYGVFHDIGKRETFEDTYQVINQLAINTTNKKYLPISYYAVFDGHSGTETSKYSELYLHSNILTNINKLLKSDKINNNIIKQGITTGILEMDDLIFKSKIPSGTTANICILAGQTLFTANVGDSRSVLCRDGKALALSYDHKPNLPKEFKRITSHNGFVKSNRVNGRLAVSRAIGDNHFKHEDKTKSPLTAQPDISVYKINKHDEFIVLACDGLWDVLTNQEAVNYIKARIDTKMDLQQISKDIVSHAINDKGSSDNVTCLIIKL